MKAKELLALIARGISTFAIGMIVTCLLVLTFAVAMFAIGASTGESYELALRNMTVFAIEASGEGLGLIVGEGLLVVGALFGCVNFLVKEVLLRILRKTTVLQTAS